MRTATTWQRLGERAPTDLVEARLQLHWAAQLVSAVGTTLLPPATDDSHTNVEWLAKSTLLAGRLTAEAPRCRAALRLADLTLYILDERAAVVAERRLHGMTLSQGMVWLEQEISAFTQRPLSKPLRRRELDLPEHRIAHGAAFSIQDAVAFAELERWYANADAALRALTERTRGASPVRCWPHHFDIAILVTMDASAGQARTIGIGMSPGDGSYAEPYWYVTPWPYPEHPCLPPLDGGGVWHRAGWTGAVLAGSKLVADQSASDQAGNVNAFLRSAAEACRSLLSTTP